MSNSYFVGICGGSGSGKTTFVNKLKLDLRDKDVCIISLDDYYLPRDEQLKDEKGIRNFDLPESIDVKSLIRDIEQLKNNQKVIKKEYTFNNEKAEEGIIEYLPSKIYIIEGLFIYHYEELKELFDLKIFIQAKENVKVIRRIKRDRIERNYDLEDVLYRYENHVLPSYEQFIGPYANEADMIINNNKSFDTAYKVLSCYLEHLL